MPARFLAEKAVKLLSDRLPMAIVVVVLYKFSCQAIGYPKKNLMFEIRCVQLYNINVRALNFELSSVMKLE